MPLLPQSQPPQTPVQRAVSQMQSDNLTLYSSLTRSIEFVFSLAWPNASSGYTAQEFFDAVGADSAKLFQAAGLIIQLAQLANPSYQPPLPTLPYTINQDGTVTVGTA